jgi:hypothetical protein
MSSNNLNESENGFHRPLKNLIKCGEAAFLASPAENARQRGQRNNAAFV